MKYLTLVYFFSSVYLKKRREQRRRRKERIKKEIKLLKKGSSSYIPLKEKVINGMAKVQTQSLSKKVLGKKNHFINNTIIMNRSKQPAYQQMSMKPKGHQGFLATIPPKQPTSGGRINNAPTNLLNTSTPLSIDIFNQVS